MKSYSFIIYLSVIAGVTYLVRMLPLTLVRGKITNRFLISFLYYMPYAVLSAMTIPAIFFAVDSVPAAFAGFAAAMLLAFLGKSLLTVAAVSCGIVALVSFFMTLI